MQTDSRITCAPGDPPERARQQKAALRKRLRAVRMALDGQQRADWDSALCGHLLAWCARHEWPMLGVYWPLAGEADLQPAYAALAARGVQLALPVVLEKQAPLGFAAWLPGEAMHKDGMGVAVPASLRMVPVPPALLVPCLGFSAQRLRLGYGGGYYDRTLAQQPRPVSAGVAYACLAAQFAGDAHDVALDVILTETGMV